MRVVLQRVSGASVSVDGAVVGAIRGGLLLLVGFTEGDGEAELEWMARKTTGIRVFPDAEGRMNRSVDEAGGELLVVSQFTLYGETDRGRRPSYVRAARPEVATPLYERFVSRLSELLPGRVRAGVFGAMMDVALINDGPVTLLLERGGGGGAWS